MCIIKCKGDNMSHSVEAIYQKAQVLQIKALELHRERYRVQGTYDQAACKIIMDDMKALARELAYGGVDFDIDFGKTK
jgi:hypothetical protein